MPSSARKPLLMIALICAACVSLWSLYLRTPPAAAPPASTAMAPVAPVDAYAYIMGPGALSGPTDRMLALSAREDGVGYQARLWLAHYYEKSLDDARAITFYRSALGLRKLAEARQVAREREALIGLLEKTGDQDGQYEEWLRALPDKKAVAALTRLSRDRADRSQLARILVSRYMYGEALAVVDGDSSVEAKLERARALAGLGKIRDALKEIEGYVRQNDGDSKAHLEYANLLERAGQISLAIREYRLAGADGLLGLGRVLQASGRRQDALPAYLESGQPEAKRRAGLLLEEMGDPLRAILVYADTGGQSTAISQECVLRALALCDRTGDRTKRAELEAMLGPGAGWIRGIDRVPVAGTAPAPAREHDAISTGKALVKAYGKEGQAMALVEAEIALAGAAPDDAVQLAEYITTLGEPRVSVRAGGQLLATGKTRQAYHLLFPRPFRDTLPAIAAEYGVDPFLVYAVMREESAFDPAIISRAGAIGLMQVMPETGKELGSRIGIKVAAEDLMSSSINMRLGTYYLGRLLKDFGGDVPKALAAYNGGPGNISRWSDTGSDRSRTRFLLNITYVETRGYVWRVIETWRIYHWLYE